jgi:DNA-binding GntR family transcriptional regulator
VPLMSAEEFDNLIELRLALEPLAAARTTARITPEIVAGLRSASMTLRQQKSAAPERLLWENLNFHFAIYRPCGSPHMVDLIESLWLRFGPLLIAAFQATPQASVDRYIDAEEDLQMQLVDAMAAGDEATAALLMRQIIRTSAAWYHDIYPFRPAPSSRRP